MGPSASTGQHMAAWLLGHGPTWVQGLPGGGPRLIRDSLSGSGSPSELSYPHSFAKTRSKSHGMGHRVPSVAAPSSYRLFCSIWESFEVSLSSTLAAFRSEPHGMSHRWPAVADLALAPGTKNMYNLCTSSFTERKR